MSDFEITEGGYYRTREGMRAGPLSRVSDAPVAVWAGLCGNAGVSAWDGGGCNTSGHRQLDLVGPWRLESGKRYILRDGRTTKPVEADPGGQFFTARLPEPDSRRITVDMMGNYGLFGDDPSSLDLIAEAPGACLAVPGPGRAENPSAADSAASGSPLRLEAGRYYQTRGGDCVGPLEAADNPVFVWRGAVHGRQPWHARFTASGRVTPGRKTSKTDIVAPWDGPIPESLVAVDTAGAERRVLEALLDAAGATKPSNPKDSVGIRKVSLSVVPAPVLAEIGLGMLEGGCKYGPHNYRVIGVRASVYYDATMRHLMAFWEGEDYDPDIKHVSIHHVTKAITSLVVLRDAMLQGKFIDDRPPRSPDGWIARLNEAAGAILDQYPDPKERYTEVGERSKRNGS